MNQFVIFCGDTKMYYARGGKLVTSANKALQFDTRKSAKPVLDEVHEYFGDFFPFEIISANGAKSRKDYV